MGCPSISELEALLRGAVPAETEGALAAHLAVCSHCRRALEDLAGGTGWLLSCPPDLKRPINQSAILRQTIKKLETEYQSLNPDRPEEPLDFLSPRDIPGTIGQLGPYEVVEKVASGGMGIVLKARDPGLNRVVAIKVLAPALARNSLARARFIREARAAAAVVHEHVVNIHAVEEFNGLPCIIMQFVKGRTLAERLRATGPMRLEEILRIGLQAASGLAAAHAQGLVHRDIKPGNILLENSVERVKLTDFGLARAVDDTTLTRTGQVAGTPEFMAPEQAGSGVVDQRADLFSLGCVLYAMATGQSPFRADTTMAVIRRVCDEEPVPLSEAAPTLPRWFSDFVHKLLAKNPVDRLQTAAEVVALLEDGLQRLQRGAPSPEVRFADKSAVGQAEQCTRLLQPRWIAAGTVVVAILAIGLFLLNRSNPPAIRPVTGLGTNFQAKPVFAVLDGKGSVRGEFAELGQAITAAQSAETIELRTDGRVKCAPVIIHGKSLRLRAGPGVQPVIWFDPGRNPLIKSDAPLVLEGLVFERSGEGDDLRLISDQNPPALQKHEDAVNDSRSLRPTPTPYTQTIVTMEEAPLLASHCRFTVRDIAWARPESGVAGLHLVGSLRCELRHCEFQSLHATGVKWDAGQSRQNNFLLLSNCVLLGRSALSFVPGARAETVIHVEQCTLASANMLHAKYVGSQPMTVELKGSVIDTASILSVPPAAKPTETLPRSWRWEGRDNLYSVHRSFLQSGPPAADTSPSLQQWRDFWKSEEPGCLEARVTFPKLPLTSGSQTNYSAAQMEFALAAGEKAPASISAGANVSAVGPGRPYHEWKRTAEAQEWERAVASVLSPSR